MDEVEDIGLVEVCMELESREKSSAFYSSLIEIGIINVISS